MKSLVQLIYFPSLCLLVSACSIDDLSRPRRDDSWKLDVASGRGHIQYYIHLQYIRLVSLVLHTARL